MDPSADEAYARQVAREKQLGDDIFRRIESLELIFRGFTTHYPASIMVKGGSFASPILPGREVPRALASFAVTSLSEKPPVEALAPKQSATYLALLVGLVVVVGAAVYMKKRNRSR
jgi:hypothetical protein